MVGLSTVTRKLGRAPTKSCFWGAEHEFWDLKGPTPQVGFAGGYTSNPTYKETPWISRLLLVFASSTFLFLFNL
uniref:peptide-methionine (S)-S-oxide reductase n=1 Tax=Vombatus ursinus TaxID=29139 RepID=A0A4X2K4V6_VOMUR